VASLHQNATELRELVQHFLQRFRVVDAAAANGPHADLSLQELRVVERLGDAGPTMMKVLAEYMPLAVNSVTSLVDKLEGQGFVRRVRSSDDRRVVHVELTDAGRAAYRAAVGEKLSLLRLMLGGLDAGEQETFMALFRKIARAG
jgi:MarR family transcriptional regulator, 2-MHQ and catechol-resistance regulon repressor